MPEMIRDRSSRSSIRRACAAALRTMASRACAVLDGSAMPRLEDLPPAHDRVDRRAQLVRQRRQELVLRPVRGPGVGVGAGVVDGDRGPLRDGLRDQHVLAVVGPPRFRRHEGHHPERATVGDERHRHVRVQLQRAQRLQVGGAARAILEHRVGDPRDHRRLPGPEDVRGGAGRVRPLGKALAQGAREFDLGGIDVRGAEPLQAAFVVGDVDCAPVSDVGHGELRDRLERGFIVERAAEDDAGAGEERRLPVGALDPLALRQLLLVQLGRRDRDGAQIAEGGSGLHPDVIEVLHAPVVEDQAARPAAADVERHRQKRTDALGGIRGVAVRQRRSRADVVDRNRRVEAHDRSVP